MPDRPWDDVVDIRDMTEADFERRNATMTVYDASGEMPQILDALCDEYDLSESAMIDRCVRVYLAYVIDTVSDHSCRERYNVKALIPPEGWIAEYATDCPVLDVEPPTGEPWQSSPSTTPTVKDMVRAALNHENVQTDQLGAFVKAACRWVASGCPQ